MFTVQNRSKSTQTSFLNQQKSAALQNKVM